MDAAMQWFGIALSVAATGALIWSAWGGGSSQ